MSSWSFARKFYCPRFTFECRSRNSLPSTAGNTVTTCSCSSCALAGMINTAQGQSQTVHCHGGCSWLVLCYEGFREKIRKIWKVLKGKSQPFTEESEIICGLGFFLSLWMWSTETLELHCHYAHGMKLDTSPFLELANRHLKELPQWAPPPHCIWKARNSETLFGCHLSTKLQI